MPAEKQFLSKKNAALRVKRSERTIKRWLAEGMPYTMMGGRKYILLEDLQAKLREQIQDQRANRFGGGAAKDQARTLQSV